MITVRTTMAVQAIQTEWECHPIYGFVLTTQESYIAAYFSRLQNERAYLQRGLYGAPLRTLHTQYNHYITTLRLVCKRWFVLLSQVYTLQEEKAKKGAQLYLSLQPERF